MRYVFHPEASAEYRNAAEYYEECRAGLGVQFTLEVEAALERIVEAPRRWPILELDVHRCLTHVFPYGILYTVERDFILVLAVMHGAREPGYWRERLRR